MRYKTLALLVVAVFTAPLLAQDWAYDETNEIHQNCELIDLLKAAHGDTAIMRFADGNTMNLAYFLDRIFGACTEWNRGEVSDAFDDTPAEPESDLEVSAVLEDHDVYSIDEADCSVMAKDRFEEDLNVSIAGANQENIAVAVYLPGTREPLDMPNTNSQEAEVLGVTVPTRVDWAVGRNFPLGRYTVDVSINDDAYRFQWLRRSRAVNTIVVTCVDADVTAAFADELRAEADNE